MTATCPNCGALDAYPHQPKTEMWLGVLKNRTTTYQCGTSTSPDWKRPVYGVGCGVEFFYRIEEDTEGGPITWSGKFLTPAQAVYRIRVILKTDEIPAHVRIVKYRTGKTSGPVRVCEVGV